MLQFVLMEQNKVVFGPWYLVQVLRKQRDVTGDQPRSIVNLDDFIRTLLATAGRIFPTLIILGFSWGVSQAFQDAAVDNMVARWVFEGSRKYLPTTSFVVSTLLALFTGNPAIAVSMLIPLAFPLAQEFSESTGYATVGAIMGGALAGEQMSPMSSGTILSSLSSGCRVRAHLATQIPYSFVVALITVVFGLLPRWPNAVGIVFGIAVIAGFVFGVCQPIASVTGAYDRITELCVREGSDTATLKSETAAFCVPSESSIVDGQPNNRGFNTSEATNIHRQEVEDGGSASEAAC